MSFIIFPGVITPPLTPGAVPYGTGSTVIMSAQGTAGQLLISGGGAAPAWSSTFPGVPPSPLTAGGVVYGTGTATAVSAAGTAGQVLTSTGAGAPTWSGAGAGDVVGPGSATDNAIARFDTTTGKLIQNSAAIVADTTGTITNSGEYVADGGSASTVAFGSTTGTTDTGIFFPSADIIGFSSAGVERARIPATGGFQAVTTISVGNAAPSTSGVGITFPATSSVSTNANTLDEYEEGTWTPSLGGTATYGARLGRYTRIGNVVTSEFYVECNTIGTGSTTTISGLPFASSTNTLGMGFTAYQATLAISPVDLNPLIGTSSTNIRFDGRTAAAATSTANLAIFGNGAAVYATVVYITD